MLGHMLTRACCVPAAAEHPLTACSSIRDVRQLAEVLRVMLHADTSRV